jgi:hypothetical protein
VAEAVTAMSATGLGVGVALVLVEGVGVGVGVGVEVAAGLVALIVAPADPVPVAVGVALGELAVAVGEVAAGVVELGAWSADGELVALVAAELTVPDADADAETETVADGVVADGVVVARAVPVTPLVMTKRPVARPTVTGRECADRMRTPCLLWLSRRESVLAGMLCQSGGSRCFLVVRASIRHQYQRPMPPLRHTSPHSFRLVARRHIRSCRPGWFLPGLTVRRFEFPVRFPSMPVCPKENRPCPFRPPRAACVI